MSLTLLAVVLLVLAGSAIIISDEWRLRLLALVLQYAAVAVLMAFEVFPALGAVRLVAGAITVMILFQSFRHSGEGVASSGKDEGWSPNLFLRVACVLLSLVVSVGLAQSYPLPNFPRDITIGTYWLALSSISSLVLTRDVSRIGFSLLMLELSAALIAGVIVETANLARFLLASLSSIVLALAVGFLVNLDKRVAISDEVES